MAPVYNCLYALRDSPWLPLSLPTTFDSFLALSVRALMCALHDRSCETVTPKVRIDFLPVVWKVSEFSFFLSIVRPSPAATWAMMSETYLILARCSLPVTELLSVTRGFKSSA